MVLLKIAMGVKKLLSRSGLTLSVNILAMVM